MTAFAVSAFPPFAIARTRPDFNSLSHQATPAYQRALGIIR